MPQIGPDIWKVALSFFWWRKYADGHEEQEFDSLTGQISPWGSKTPDGLVAAGWVPVSAELAVKMRSGGEFGTPTQAPSVIVAIKPGEELIISKDCGVFKGYRAHCMACNASFESLQKPSTCPVCGASIMWRCPTCSKLSDTEVCPDCKTKGRLINPFNIAQASWERVDYLLGIKGRFLQRFNSKTMITE